MAFEPEELVREWLASWNAHDLERIMAHYADDVVFYSPYARIRMGIESGRVDGKARLREYFTDGLRVNPGLRFDLLEWYTGANSVAIRYKRENGRTTVEMMAVNDKGMVVEGRAHYDRIG